MDEDVQFEADGRTRSGVVKHKVTADFVLDLYAVAKKKRGKNREALMAEVKLLSQNLGAFLVEEEAD